MADKVDETTPVATGTAAPVQVECPKCNHKFWHKIGDGFKKLGEGALEGVVDVAASTTGAGSED